jgi:hypothetical protein
MAGFFTMLRKNAYITQTIYKKGLMSWDVEFEENFTGSSQQCSIPQFEFFEECTI